MFAHACYNGSEHARTVERTGWCSLQWKDSCMTRPLPSEGSARTALTSMPVAANDDVLLYAVLATSTDCITFGIAGDDDLEREHGRRFGPQAAERADLYAYEITATLGIPLTFSFTPEVRGDA